MNFCLGGNLLPPATDAPKAIGIGGFALEACFALALELDIDGGNVFRPGET